METTSSNKPNQLPEESKPIFSEGIYLLLSRWSALRMAVDNEWGGRGSRQLADQLGSDIFSWFTLSKEPLYIDDLENILDEGMNSLNTDVDDGSIEEVAEKLMIMHEECLEGNYNSIEKLRKEGHITGMHQHVRQAVGDDDDSDSDDNMDDDNGANMEVDAPKSQPNSNTVNMAAKVTVTKEEGQGDDGWEIVTSKRNRGKRN